jgi:hypothetical protein
MTKTTKNSPLFASSDIPIRTDHRTVRLARDVKHASQIINKYKSTIKPEDMAKLSKKYPELKLDLAAFKIMK